MTEQQAKQWLVDNGFYTERDIPSGETYLAEATIDIDQEHIDIVITCSLARDKELTKLREDRKKLVEALEDFELRVNHAGDCSARFQYGGGCNCMDLNYFSLQSCADRARQTLEALKEISEDR